MIDKSKNSAGKRVYEKVKLVLSKVSYGRLVWVMYLF